MPIFKFRKKLILYSHIPKCAGQSIENYCQRLGAKIAFMDNDFCRHNFAGRAWNLTSPQHISGDALSRLFPKDFFDDSFAVVRDPIDRLRSAFKFQKYKEKKIKENITLSDFIKSDLGTCSRPLGLYDNHFLPQVELLVKKNSYKIFKLENGLLDVKKYLDNNLFFNDSDKKLKHINLGTYNIEFSHEDTYVDDSSLEIISRIYKRDFEVFRYEIIR